MVENKDIVTPEDLGLLEFYKSNCNYSSVLTAIEIGLFDFLNKQDKYTSIPEIKQGCELLINDRNLLDFLDVLFTNNHLLREDVGLTSKYKIKHKYYVKENPNNLIGVMMSLNKTTLGKQHLPTVLKTGKDYKPLATFDTLYSSPEKANAFFREMIFFQEKVFTTIAENVDMSKYSKVLDVGGSIGQFLIKVKQQKKNEHLECRNYEIPYIENYFNEYVKENNLEGKVTFIRGDFFKEDLPKTDVIHMGNILHAFDLGVKKMLMKKAFECLSPNGIFIVSEEFINRNKFDMALTISNLMTSELQTGYNITPEELEELGKEAGFTKFELLREKYGVDFAILYKN